MKHLRISLLALALVASLGASAQEAVRPEVGQKLVDRIKWWEHYTAINEGEMTVIPKGVAHQNVGHGPNIEITIYARNSLRRLAPLDAAAARERMRIRDGKPVMPPVTLDTDPDQSR